MKDDTATTTRRRAAGIGLTAALLGAGVGLASIAGTDREPTAIQLAGANEDLSGNCDEAEHASDPECAGSSTTIQAGSSTTVATSTLPSVDDGSGRGASTTSTPAPAASAPAPGSTRTVSAGDAGSITVAVEAGGLRLTGTAPHAGWRVEVERESGREIEVQFTTGTRRIDVNVELEDGQVRERVRVRGDARSSDDD